MTRIELAHTPTSGLALPLSYILMWKLYHNSKCKDYHFTLRPWSDGGIMRYEVRGEFGDGFPLANVSDK